MSAQYCSILSMVVAELLFRPLVSDPSREEPPKRACTVDVTMLMRDEDALDVDVVDVEVLDEDVLDVRCLMRVLMFSLCLAHALGTSFSSIDRIVASKGLISEIFCVVANTSNSIQI